MSSSIPESKVSVPTSAPVAHASASYAHISAPIATYASAPIIELVREAARVCDPKLSILLKPQYRELLADSKVIKPHHFPTEESMWQVISKSAEPILAYGPQLKAAPGATIKIPVTGFDDAFRLAVPDDATEIEKLRPPYRTFDRASLHDASLKHRKEGGVHLYDATIPNGVDRLDFRVSMLTNVLDETNIMDPTLSQKARVILSESEPVAVISSMGAITPSHCDLFPAFNRSFVGTKLWTIVPHDDFDKTDLWCDTCARPETCEDYFDVVKFMRIPSARWVVVNDGTTFYLPNRYAHRVYTIRPYIGTSKSYLSIHQAGGILRHWIFTPPKLPKCYDESHFWEALCTAIEFKCKQFGQQCMADTLEKIGWLIPPQCLKGRRNLKALLEGLQSAVTSL